MIETAAHRFPSLAPPEPVAPDAKALGLSLSLIPLPVGEVSVLLTAWLLLLSV